jgi:hypothetical protein
MYYVVVYNIKWRLGLKVSKGKNCAIIKNLFNENKKKLDSRCSVLSIVLGRRCVKDFQDMRLDVPKFASSNMRQDVL